MIIGRIFIISITVGILYIAFRYEDYFIRIETKLFNRIGATVRALRHRLGRWLLRDAVRKPISDETRERIALEYAADHGIVFKAVDKKETAQNSDDAFMELLYRMEVDG